MMNSEESFISNFTETKVDMQHPHLPYLPFVFINKEILIFVSLEPQDVHTIIYLFFNNLFFVLVFNQINSFLRKG